MFVKHGCDGSDRRGGVREHAAHKEPLLHVASGPEPLCHCATGIRTMVDGAARPRPLPEAAVECFQTLFQANNNRNEFNSGGMHSRDVLPCCQPAHCHSDEIKIPSTSVSTVCTNPAMGSRHLQTVFSSDQPQRIQLVRDAFPRYLLPHLRNASLRI
jgi:hypothetical protein